jgi:GNAT superfamily N-acetyltransferase
VELGPIPGLEHLPFAEVWFAEIDDERLGDASAAARRIGKQGLEAWTTDRTPAVVAYLEHRGFEEVRRYVISELDVGAAARAELSPVRLTTLAESPELGDDLYEIACECYPDQPGRGETRIGTLEQWRVWGRDRHRPESYFIAVDGERPLAYGYLETDGPTTTHGFLAVRRGSRGLGLGGAIKRAQIEWARGQGIPALRTATETRLTGLRALNDRLGYVPLYEEVVLRGPAAG